jgi:hypothetical protein
MHVTQRLQQFGALDGDFHDGARSTGILATFKG